MDKIKELLNYQSLDMELNRLENEFYNSPARLKIKKDTDLVNEQIRILNEMNEQFVELNDRLDGISDILPKLEDQYKKLFAEFETNKPETKEEAHELLTEVKKIIKDISNYEKELKSLNKRIVDMQKNMSTRRNNAAKLKREVLLLRESYTEEFEKQKDLVRQKKKELLQEAKNVDPKLLERYNEIRPHVIPPVVKLNGNQCGGCNMSLPSADLATLNQGINIMECSNCGRLIIKED